MAFAAEEVEPLALNMGSCFFWLPRACHQQLKNSAYFLSLASDLDLPERHLERAPYLCDPLRQVKSLPIRVLSQASRQVEMVAVMVCAKVVWMVILMHFAASNPWLSSHPRVCVIGSLSVVQFSALPAVP